MTTEYETEVRMTITVLTQTGEHHKKTIRTMLVSALFCKIWQLLGLFDKYNMYILGKYKID
jgi:hypothetical protein